MKIQFFCPRWGSEALPAEDFIARVRLAGYDGVEVALTEADPEGPAVVRQATAEGLPMVVQHCDTFTRNLAAHLEQFEARLRTAAALRPLFINSHTGRDVFTLEENEAAFALAARVASDTGLPIVHETHRGRCCHTPWRTVDLLRARPEVRLALDLSHWCNVCESLLEDQGDFLLRVLPHVDHVHARVGWAHGPQVSDPRAPEWGAAVDAHLVWWDRIVALKRAAGAATFTITPEFGPVPYLPVLPYTQQPVANPWELNHHMMQLLRSRYATAQVATP